MLGVPEVEVPEDEVLLFAAGAGVGAGPRARAGARRGQPARRMLVLVSCLPWTTASYFLLRQLP